MITLPDNRILLEDQASGTSIRVTTSPTEAFVQRLGCTHFGNEGLRYQRLNVAEQLARLPSPYFVELQQKKKLVGTYAIAQHRIDIGDQNGIGLYRGLLTIRDRFRSSGLGRILVTETLRWIDRCAVQSALPIVSWGCVESRNVHSRQLLESERAQEIGCLHSMLVYRQWPKSRGNIDLQDANSTELTRALKATYGDCLLRNQRLDGQSFLVLRDNHGAILAGARVQRTSVKIQSTGSAWDSAYRHLLKYVPAARRRYDPRCFTYLRLSDVLVMPGQERAWRPFLSALLKQHDTYMAMFILDPTSVAFRGLRQAGIFGCIARSTRQSIGVLARTWNVDPGLLKRIANAPLGMEPLDL